MTATPSPAVVSAATAADNSSRIAILICPEATASTSHGMFDLFMSVGRDWGLIVDGLPGRRLMRPLLVARDAKPFMAANGVWVWPGCSLTECPPVDVICVPELVVSPTEIVTGRFEAEIDWIRRCHEGGAIIATACSGALLLAEAGLLDGWEATTHWAFCDALAERFPHITVRPRRALVVSGEGQRLVMAGGGTSWFDLALYLIARLHGVEEAMRTARINLIDWHHSGQQPFARLTCSRQTGDAVITRCQVWLAEHYDQPAPVAAVVQLSGLAERSFKRRFQQATGMTPLEYVHTLRLEEAKQMLEAGDEPVEAIANAVGYEDAGFFGKLFRRAVGLTPAQYRRRFGLLRQALVPMLVSEKADS